MNTRGRRVVIAVTVTLAWAVGACAAKKTSSENLRTKGFGAAIRVEAPGEKRGRVFASLYAGSPHDPASPLVELEEDDHLTVTVAGTTTRLREEKNPLTGAPHYVAEFPEPPPRAAVDVALVRPSDISAPKSSCTMPETFEVLSPVEGAELVFGGDDLVVHWDGSGGPDSMVVSLDGECVSLLPTLTVDDTGTVTIPAASVKLKASCPSACRAPATSCDVLLRLGKARSGALDPALGQGGTIDCVQGRSVLLQMRNGPGAPPDAGADGSVDGG